MNRYFSLAIISLVMLISLSVICFADDSPSIVLFTQGGESSISDGSDGTYVVNVKEVVPYSYFADGPVSHLITVEKLLNLSYPIKAAFGFKNADGDSSSLVEISNISLTDENKNLELQIKPLTFYDGNALSNYENDFDWKNNTEVTSTDIGIYMELPVKPPVDVDQNDVASELIDFILKEAQ